MVQKVQQTRVAFPLELNHIPSYVNATLVFSINGDILINFGFIDPSMIQPTTDSQITESEISNTGNEEVSIMNTVTASPIAKIITNKLAAKQLISQLQEVLSTLEDE
jgi:hypothetical protein